MQMVGVAQHHLAANVLQVKSRQAALDGAGRGNVHEGRGLHRAVHRCKLAAAGIVLLFQQFVGHGMASSIVSELFLMVVDFTE